jgi:hypothetical protein
MTEKKGRPVEGWFKPRSGDTQPSRPRPGFSYENPPAVFSGPDSYPHIIDDEIDEAREKAEALADSGKEDMLEAKKAALSEKPNWFTRGAGYSWRKTKDATGYSLGTAKNDTVDTSMRIIDRAGGVAKGVGYGISGFFAGIENWGHKKLNSKGLKWMAHIPLFGRLVKSKPEKTWKERDEDKAKEIKKNKSKKKQKKKESKELEDLGLTKEQADALLGINAKKSKEAADGKKKDDKKDDAPKDDKK